MNRIGIMYHYCARDMTIHVSPEAQVVAEASQMGDQKPKYHRSLLTF